MTINLGGPAFLLFITFLVLKLTKVILWSWVWVTAPLWVGFAVAMFAFLVIVGVGALVAGNVRKRDWRD